LPWEGVCDCDAYVVPSSRVVGPCDREACEKEGFAMHFPLKLAIIAAFILAAALPFACHG